MLFQNSVIQTITGYMQMTRYGNKFNLPQNGMHSPPGVEDKEMDLVTIQTDIKHMMVGKELNKKIKTYYYSIKWRR